MREYWNICIPPLVKHAPPLPRCLHSPLHPVDRSRSSSNLLATSFQTAVFVRDLDKGVHDIITLVISENEEFAGREKITSFFNVRDGDVCR